MVHYTHMWTENGIHAALCVDGGDNKCERFDAATCVRAFREK